MEGFQKQGTFTFGQLKTIKAAYLHVIEKH